MSEWESRAILEAAGIPLIDAKLAGSAAEAGAAAERFGSPEDSRGFSAKFFQWYNADHRHSSIAYLTPESVHYGRVEEILKKRAQTLRDAFEANPKRFKGRCPQPEALPKAVWINKPDS